jgi:hypothetical protein
MFPLLFENKLQFSGEKCKEGNGEAFIAGIYMFIKYNSCILHPEHPGEFRPGCPALREARLKFPGARCAGSSYYMPSD